MEKGYLFKAFVTRVSENKAEAHRWKFGEGYFSSL
jgi:hypothetical protein